MNLIPLINRIVVLILISFSVQVFSATADYYKCTNKAGGEWNYGRAPSVCDASAFGSDKQIQSDYSKIIFSDSASRPAERTRYMTELNAMIRDAAMYYFKKRKPTISTDELNYLVLAMQATASQESYWSHYRQIPGDKNIKMMRGDVGHGHGLMQIDDRSHFDAINSGVAWNLITNLTYGMDIFYSAWLKSATASCINSPTNYINRIRSAWSAYNGGSGSICRWANPNSAWAKNDTGFYNNLNQRRWTAQVTDAQKKSSVDVACLIEKRENCAAPNATTPVDQTALSSGKLYKNEVNSKFCIVNDNTAYCVQDQRDSLCLKSIDSSFDPSVITTSADQVLQTYNPKSLDRHSLCADYDNQLLKVGTAIKLVKSINLRSTPAGGILQVVPQNSVLQILDFEIRDSNVNDHYYQVSYNNQIGFIYAGDKSNYTSWVIPQVQNNDPIQSLPSVVAKAGQKIKIINTAGINIRQTAAGIKLGLAPKNTILNVLDVVVQGSENKIYYKIKYNSIIGYIYTGALLPQNSVNLWTQINP